MSTQNERFPDDADELRLSGCISDSIVDGPGMRYVIFTQGCPHHCPGCHNTQTHDFSGGYIADAEDILREISENPLCGGVTFSGGEPFCQAKALDSLAEKILAMGKDIVAYSGYTLEQLLEKGKQDAAILSLLRKCRLLIDGPYIEAQRDLTLQFRGSRNQRIITIADIPEL